MKSVLMFALASAHQESLLQLRTCDFTTESLDNLADPSAVATSHEIVCTAVADPTCKDACETHVNALIDEIAKACVLTSCQATFINSKNPSERLAAQFNMGDTDVCYNCVSEHFDQDLATLQAANQHYNTGKMHDAKGKTHEQYFEGVKNDLQGLGREVKIGPYSNLKKDPSHATYAAGGGGHKTMAKRYTDGDANVVESHEDQAGYRKGVHIGSKQWLVEAATTNAGDQDPTSGQPEDKGTTFYKQWPPKKLASGTYNVDDALYKKKFLTSGKVDYGWRFHELSEKAYTKEVRSTAGGNLTTLKDTTSAQFSNENEKVTNTADTLKNTRENTKVYKGSSATKTLLQKKALPYSNETKIETTDAGYTRGTTNAQTTQSGTVGAGNSQETGTFTSQEGGNYVSVLEMPKVTAKKTGVVDVEWRGGDSYTTSKMMNGMKKFIKRAARGEKW